MKFLYQAGLLSMLVVSSLVCGQASTKSTSRSDASPLEVNVTKGPLWKDTCLELSLQLTNRSESAVFLNATYEGIKIYSSVSDTNTLGQGSGEAWMLVYGWTDVVPEPISLAPGVRKQIALCIAGTFPVKETGKAALRQVRVQGKLRIVVEYDIAERRFIHRLLGRGKGAYVLVPGIPSVGTRRDIVLEIKVPCPKGTCPSDCLSPPPIFPGEHDVHTIELEPPPSIEIQQPTLPTLPIFPIDRPPPPKP